MRTDRRAIITGGFGLLLGTRAFAQTNRCDVGRNLASLGKALKSYSGDLGGMLLTSNNPYCSGSEVISDFGILATRQDYEKAISSYASASGSFGGGGGNISAYLSKSYSKNLTSVSVAFTKRVVRSYYEIPPGTYISDAINRCADARDFLQKYGDHAIYKVGVGGLCCYVFNYEFSSEKEATDFKANIGVNYGTGKGSYSTSQTTSFSKQKAKVKLYGFTQGAISSPKISGVGDVNGVFSTDFSTSNLKSLLDYFNTFENEFSSSFNENDGYSEVYVWTKPITQIPSSCTKLQQDAIIATSAQAKAVMDDLARQIEIVEQNVAYLDYMTGPVATFNTKTSLNLAPRIREKLETTLLKLANRKITLEARLDLDTKYDFRSEIPVMPTEFCVRDPVKKSQAYSLPLDGKFKIYKFPVEPGDTTCTIEAKGSFSRSRSETGYGRYAIVLLETLKAGTNVSGSIEEDVSSWYKVGRLKVGQLLKFDNRIFKILNTAGALLTRTSASSKFNFPSQTFSPADPERYCIGAFCEAELKTRSIELSAFVSR